MKDGNREKKREGLRKIRLQATMLQVGFGSEDIGEVLQCQAELEALADRLLAEHGDLVTAARCSAARGRLDDFVALLDEILLGHFNDSGIPPGTSRPKPPNLT